ncbi:MAG: hypothetical protein K9F97_02435 [Candidatus Nanopelagicales bacterium]|nr:hypothetical protein [Candidatus Nanopelagicales bacterium]
MNIDFKKVLPKDPSIFDGFRTVRVITGLFLLLGLVRSCIHLFASDGGSSSIAGVDTTVTGGDNIIAIFHQWGAIQLILALLLSLLFLRYPGFTPLVLLTLAIDPILRWIAGRMLPLTTVGTPPGESLNWVAFFLLAVLFVCSLVRKNHK